MDEQDGNPIFLGAACTIGSFDSGPNIPPDGQMSSCAPPSRSRLTSSGVLAIGTNHDADLAKRRAEHGRFGPRCVANRFVPQSVLAIFADEFSVRIDENGRVIAMLAVGFEQAGHQKDVEPIGQLGQSATILAVWNRLAEGPVFIERNRLVLDRIAVEKALGRTNQLCPAAERLQ